VTLVYPGVIACPCGAPTRAVVAVDVTVESAALEPHWCGACGLSLRDHVEGVDRPRYGTVCPDCERSVPDLNEHLRAHVASDRRVDP
jgi:hypothetical protein